MAEIDPAEERDSTSTDAQWSTYAETSPGGAQEDPGRQVEQTRGVPEDASAPAGLVVDSATPASGPIAGGTSVVLAGSGFQEGAIQGVSFNGTPAASFTADSDTQITATTASVASAGVGEVSVTRDDNAQAAVAWAYTGTGE